MFPNSIGSHVQLMCTVVIYLPQEALEQPTQALISTTPHSIPLLFLPFCFFKIRAKTLPPCLAGIIKIAHPSESIINEGCEKSHWLRKKDEAMFHYLLF